MGGQPPRLELEDHYQLAYFTPDYGEKGVALFPKISNLVCDGAIDLRNDGDAQVDFVLCEKGFGNYVVIVAHERIAKNEIPEEIRFDEVLIPDFAQEQYQKGLKEVQAKYDKTFQQGFRRFQTFRNALRENQIFAHSEPAGGCFLGFDYSQYFVDFDKQAVPFETNRVGGEYAWVGYPSERPLNPSEENVTEFQLGKMEPSGFTVVISSLTWLSAIEQKMVNSMYRAEYIAAKLPCPDHIYAEMSSR